MDPTSRRLGIPRLVPGKERAATSEERVGTRGPTTEVQEPHPRSETSGALSRAGRSPPHPTPAASAVTHGRCSLARSCALRATGTCSPGALRSLLAHTLQTPGVASVTRPRPQPRTALRPSPRPPAPTHQPWPGPGTKSRAAHCCPNWGKELRAGVCGEGRGARGVQG